MKIHRTTKVRRPSLMVMAAAVALFQICATADAQQPGAGGRQRQGRPEAVTPGPATPPADGAEARPNAPGALPPDKTTSHTLRLGANELAFNATAGTIPLFNEQTGAVTVRIAYIAFKRTDGATGPRPVTFVWNGGPGYVSAWLNLGAIGPWRLDMAGAATRPSASPIPGDNQESWLDFTDLVFIDPPGTGFGTIPGGDDARKFLWSVNGDISALASTVRRWLVDNGRMSSRKYLVGESYGGFRAPKVAHRLQTTEGVGIDGIVMVSPVLDFGRFRSNGVLSHVARLPSYAATAREKKAPVSPADLVDVEAYAQGEFLSDLMKGLKDRNAVAKLAEKVTGLTGLPRPIVERFAGRVPMNVFVREIHRAEGRIASMYDGSETGLDPNPQSQGSEADDQLLRGLQAPLTSTMVGIYQDKLQWMASNSRYLFQNEAAGRQWDYGNRNAEATRDLAAAMALDSSMHVLVAHGLTDLVTPYFETKMVLDQMPPIGDPSRMKFQLYSGGHMFYSREASRKAFAADAREMMSPR